MNDYGTMCGSKKKHMYLSHCLHKLLQFYRPQSRLGQLGRWFCVRYHFFFSFFFCERCFSTEVAAKTKAWSELLHIQLRGGCVVLGALPTPPLPASWLWDDPAPQSSCPLACLQMGPQKVCLGGGAVHPWRINQKALLVRVFSSMFVSLFTQIHSRNTSAAWVS